VVLQNLQTDFSQFLPVILQAGKNPQ